LVPGGTSPCASPGLLRPFDDIGLRARSPWVCLTQHLPLSHFLSASGAYFSQSLRPCFMPLPPIGFSPSEFFPHTTAQRPFLARCPLGLTRQRRVWCFVLLRGEDPASFDTFDSPVARTAPKRARSILNESSRRRAAGYGGSSSQSSEELSSRGLPRWEVDFLHVPLVRRSRDGPTSRVSRWRHRSVSGCGRPEGRAARGQFGSGHRVCGVYEGHVASRVERE